MRTVIKSIPVAFAIALFSQSNLLATGGHGHGGAHAGCKSSSGGSGNSTGAQTGNSGSQNQENGRTSNNDNNGGANNNNAPINQNGGQAGDHGTGANTQTGQGWGANTQQ